MENVVDKIKKLLALSTSNNPHESELALMHAKRIAAENDIDIALVEIFGQSTKKQDFTKNQLNLGQRKSITQQYVSWILGEHFDVKVIYTGNREMGRSLILIGRKDKVTIAEFVQHFLNKEFMNLWHNYYETTNCDLKARDSFLLGLYKGLTEKLTRERQAVETEKLGAQPETVKNQFSLMVVSEKDSLQKFTEQLFPKLRKPEKYHIRGEFSDDALNTGMIKGAQINIRPTLSSGYYRQEITA